jgi:hypothetical protein
MNDPQPQEKVLRISGVGGDAVIVNLEASEAVSVRLEIDAKCNCQDEANAVNRPGSYIYSDPSGRKN